MSALASWLKELSQPEYVHVLLNPLPVYGMSVALLALVIALIARSRDARTIGLFLILMICAVFPLIVHFGEAGYDRVYAMSYQDGQAWLQVHRARAETWEWIFYATGISSLLALLLPRRAPRWRRPTALLTVALAAGSILAAAYISSAGGKVRHSEFRNGPPPQIQSKDT